MKQLFRALHFLFLRAVPRSPLFLALCGMTWGIISPLQFLRVSTANALGLKIEKFNPLNASDLRKWKEFLARFPGADARTVEFSLQDHTVISALRIETACKEGACPTIFRYKKGKEYIFSIVCSESIEVFDQPFKVSTSELVQSIQVSAGAIKITITPTSFGPIIGTTSK